MARRPGPASKITRADQILNFLKDALRITYTPRDIAEALNIPRSTVRRELPKLAREGKIVKPKKGIYSQEEVKFRRHYLAIAVYCDKKEIATDDKGKTVKTHVGQGETKGGRSLIHNIAVWTYTPLDLDKPKKKKDLSKDLASILLDWLVKQDFGDCYLQQYDIQLKDAGTRNLTFGYENKEEKDAKDVPVKEIWKKYGGPAKW